MRPSINKPGLQDSHAHQLAARLAEGGHRLTRPRSAVLAQVAASSASFTATELLESVATVAPEVGRATVFRTLDLLVELGLVRRVHTESAGNWGHSYVLCDLAETHHHHLVCTSCGRVADFEGCGFDSMLPDLQARTSFRVEGHRLELYGLCEACQREQRE